MYMTGRSPRSSVTRAFSAAAAAVVLSGCATKGDIRALQIELRVELQEQAARQDSLMAMLRRDAESTQDTLRTQSDQLFDFRGDITRLLQSITQGQARLEALVGETQRSVASLRDQGGNTRGAAGPSLGDGVTRDTAAPSPRGEAVAGVGGNADQLYGVARDQHQRGSLSSAQQAYEQFLREYSGDVRAADAQFFLADIMAQQNHPADALAAFQRIPTLHPEAPRVPDALYRIAGLQIELGNNDDARATLQRIIATFPESSFALIARGDLEELR